MGAVTCYIKEGSRPGNYLTRFIGYEYVTAQAAARRGQNVLGAVACLAGGAQLHSRANLLALGGRIDTTSLAEDTITTFETQLRGRRVVFEPHAICWAEEPGTDRGPVEAAAPLGARQRAGHHPLPQALVPAAPRAPPRRRSPSALCWFCLFLQPVFMITSSAALLTLYFTGSPRAWPAFHVLWITNAATYLFITGFALLIDPSTARRTWRQAVMFPGAGEPGDHRARPAFPGWSAAAARTPFTASGLSPPHVSWVIVFVYAWLGGSLAVGLPGEGGRAETGRPAAQRVPALPGGLRDAAVRLHVRLLRQGAAAGGDDAGTRRRRRER